MDTKTHQMSSVTIDYCEGHSGRGWYWWDSEYPEEGSQGPYPTYDAAVASGIEAYGDEFSVELNAHTSRISELEEQLAAVLAMDKPRPLSAVLKKLLEATDHLLRDHDCDAHGWELIDGAKRAAETLVPIIEKAASALLLPETKA